MLNLQSIMLQLSGKAKQQNTTQMWIQELSQPVYVGSVESDIVCGVQILNQHIIKF